MRFDSAPTQELNSAIRRFKNAPHGKYIVAPMKAELEKRFDIWYERCVPDQIEWGTKADIIKQLKEKKIIDLSGLLE